LTGIECYAPNPTTPSLVWSYNLSYSTSSGSSRSLLVDVSRIGALGGRQLAKQFQWKSAKGPVYSANTPRETDVEKQQGPERSDSPHFLTPTHLNTAKPIVADFNHDGKDKILTASYQSIPSQPNQAPTNITSYEIISSSPGQPLLSSSASAGLSGAILDDARVGDIDGDGILEVIAPVVDPSSALGTYFIYRLNLNTLQYEQKEAIAPYIGPNIDPGDVLFVKNPLYLVDLDGDGLVDLITGDRGDNLTYPSFDESREPALPDFLNYIWSVRWNAKGSFGQYQTIPFNFDPAEPGAFFAPMTGGRHEAFITNDQSGRNQLIFASEWSNLYDYPNCIITPYMGVDLDAAGNLAPISIDTPMNLYSAFADMNGDGIEDSVEYEPTDQRFCITKFGQGDQTDWDQNPQSNSCIKLSNADPYYNIDPEIVGCSSLGKAVNVVHAPWKLLVFDMDADGRDDVMLLHLDKSQLPDQVPDGTGYRVYMDATGKLQQQYYAHAPYLVGDFDGDGWLDVLELDDSGFAIVNVLKGATEDLLIGVSDENTSQPTEKITYSNIWWAGTSNWPGQIWAPVLAPGGPAPPATILAGKYPTQPIRHGMRVVREHDIYQGDDIGGYVHAAYAYSDPAFDLRGRGFVGFRVVEKWEPDVPTDTVTIYDTRATPEGFYPNALRPGTVWRITPLINEQFGALPNQQFGSPLGNPSILPARIVRADIVYQLVALNNNKTYFVHPSSWVTQEWEDTGGLLVYASADVIPHTEKWDPMSTLKPWDGPPDPFGPYATLLRYASGNFTYDLYGNITDEMGGNFTYKPYLTTGGDRYHISTKFYSADLVNWLVGLPQSQLIASGPSGSKDPTPHRTDYVFAGGLLKQVLVEPGNPDPTIPLTYTFQRNGDGSVTSVRASAAGEPDRLMSYNYEPTERIFVSNRRNALGHTESLLTDPALGVLVSARDPNGITVQTQIDEFGHPRTVIPDGAAATYISYAPRLTKSFNNGVTVSTVGQDGSGASAVFDPYGRVITAAHKAFDGSGIYQGATYDLLGRLIGWSRPGFNAPSKETGKQRWDSLNRLVERITPDNRDWSYTNSFARTKWADPSGHVLLIDRDVDGRVVDTGQVSPANKELLTTFKYGDFGLLATVTDPENHETSYTHDQRGRALSVTDPDAGTTTFSYNGFGDVTAQTAAGSATHFTPDPLGRVKEIQNADGLTQFKWDWQSHGLGKIAESVSPDNVIHDFAYDNFGRLAGDRWTIDNKPSLTIAYGYDALGRVNSISYPPIPGINSTPSTVSPTATPFDVGFAYNSSGYLDSVSRLYVNQVANSPPSYKAYWTTTSMGVDDLPTGGTFGNGIAAQRTFEPASGRLSTAFDDGLTLYQYHYQPDGRLGSYSKTFSFLLPPIVETFGYDALDRLSTWSVADTAGTRNVGYGYDDIGNSTSESLDGAPIATYHYGQNGGGPHALTTSPNGTLSYDLRGRLKADATRQFAYTEFDLPKTLTIARPNRIPPLPPVITSFRYDAEHRRILKSDDSKSVVTLAGLYEERRQGANTARAYYVPGPEGVVAQVIIDETTNKEIVQYLHHDRLGSIRNVTDAQGKQIWRLGYEPFGERANLNGSPAASPSQDVQLGFDELRHDDELGLIDQRGRVYDPSIHRFLTPDPLVSRPLNGQSYNHYSYVLNDPANVTDPSGFDPFEDTMGDPDGSAACSCTESNPYVPQPTTSEPGVPSGDRTGGTTSAQHQSTAPVVTQAGTSAAPVPSMPVSRGEDGASADWVKTALVVGYLPMAITYYEGVYLQKGLHEFAHELGVSESDIQFYNDATMAAGVVLPEALEEGVGALETEAVANLQHVLRGGSGDRGIGVVHLDASELSPAQINETIAVVRDMDFQAGMANGLVRTDVKNSTFQLGPNKVVRLRSAANTFANLARTALNLDQQAAGHIPDVGAGGSPLGPLMGQDSGINNVIGGQWGRYAPGFTFDGFSLVDRSTGAFLYTSHGLEMEPAPILDFR
jgi:RHS repeat-associated protein